jgi:hypothetical protein
LADTVFLGIKDDKPIKPFQQQLIKFNWRDDGVILNLPVAKVIRGSLEPDNHLNPDQTPKFRQFTLRWFLLSTALIEAMKNAGVHNLGNI